MSQIKKYRNEGRPIYYLDETSIEIGQNAVMYPTENNSFTVLHIGGDEGFVKSILLFLKAKRNDSNEEIRKTLFEEWFAKTLSKLKDGAVIVLHQSSCHSRPLEEFPTTSTPKVDIQKWLSTKGVPFEDDMVRTELLALVKRMKPSAKRYLVDEMAKAENKSVLRLPPYHSELNPLRSIWGRIKDDVEAKRPRNKLKDFRSLVVDAVARVSVEDWRKAITDVEKVEEEMWQLDIDMEQQIEPLLVNCSSTESETESE